MDGGIVDNLPVSAARALGADFVIGANVFEPDYQRGSGLISGGLVAIETLVRHAGGGVGLADYLISPSTAGNSFISFGASQELILLGKKAALESLSGLLAAIKAYH
jgi:NTE family protein